MDEKSEEEGKKNHMSQQRTVPAPPVTENFVACTHDFHDATIRPDVSGRSTSESQSKITAAQKYSTVTSSTDPRSQQRETDTNHFHEKSSDTEVQKFLHAMPGDRHATAADFFPAASNMV